MQDIIALLWCQQNIGLKEMAMKFAAEVLPGGNMVCIPTQKKLALIKRYTPRSGASETVRKSLASHVLVEEENKRLVWWLTEKEMLKRMICIKRKTVT